MRIDVSQAAKMLMEADDIALYCHRDPDGDTFGSASALYDCLSSMGKRVKILCTSPVPKNLRFLMREYPQFEEKFIAAIDTSATKLLGDGEIRNMPVDLCIDHHVSNEFYAKNTCLYDFTSAGELVFDIICAMGCKISPFAATSLLTAISSDTGSFKYHGVTGKTMRCVASLLDSGADSDMVRENLYESHSKSRLMIEAMALSNMEFYCDDRIAVIMVSRSMMESCSATEEDLEGIAPFSIKVKTVKIGFTLKEQTDGTVKVSVRTGEGADSCKICRAFEGGGHIRASGCRIKASLQDARDMLLKEAEKQLGDK